MKLVPSPFALLLATLLAGSVAFAEQSESKKSDTKPAKAPCGCAVPKDGKVCGVDKDCCCTGEKASGKAGDQKPADKKPAIDAKPTDEKKTAASEANSGAACAPCDACRA